MKSNGSFATTTSAGVLLVLMLAAGAAHSLPCVACEVSTSYHSAVRVYDQGACLGHDCPLVDQSRISLLNTARGSCSEVRRCVPGASGGSAVKVRSGSPR